MEDKDFIKKKAKMIYPFVNYGKLNSKELFKNNEELLQIQQKRLNFITQSYFEENIKAKKYKSRIYKALKYMESLDSLDSEQFYILEKILKGE